MTAKELRKKFIEFFVARGHKEIPSASLVPENDPSVLFTTAGMHPLVPYLLGEPHPLGKRLCSVQKCLRTGDIESVGDTSHQTFFEMLGNWSLNDYWKKEMIPWSYELLTQVFNVPIEKVYVTCFAGDKDAPKDEESAQLWQKVGIPKERIYFLGKEDNWWGPAGKTGPCGPDSEMFFDTGRALCGPNCRPGCGCGKFFEIGNDVFMEYNKTEEGKFVPLKQRNIDTGYGIERNVTVLNGFDDSFRTELFWPIIQEIEKISGKSYEEEKNKRPMRIIADHLRASAFVIADGISPSNTEQGYILRRLIRRAIRNGHLLGIDQSFVFIVAEKVIMILKDVYPELEQSKERIKEELNKEEERFSQTLKQGEKEFERLFQHGITSGKEAFYLFETYGFPFELTKEMVKEKGMSIDEEGFEKAFKEHQQISRAGSEKRFAGGLADHSETVIKYHTATHLIHAALRKVIGEHVQQVGSNLTAERLRFDFTHPSKLTEEEINKVQVLVNEQIEANNPVELEEMTLEEARNQGALAFFGQKYGDRVKVYTTGNFSKEVCGGPHVTRTGEIGKIEIYKEETVGTGKRRIYARIKT